MLGENPDTTNNQLVPPLFLKKDDNQGRSEKGGSVSPRRPYGFRYGEAQEDSSSEEDIQKQKPLESIVAAFQPRSNTGFRRFDFLERPLIVTIDSEIIHMSANPNLPRATAVRWEGSEAFQSYFWKTEPSTTDVGQAHTDLNAMRRSRMRQILEHSVVINHWSISEAFQPRSSGAELPTATADLVRPDKNAIWDEILERFNEIAQREDNWDGLGSLKPNRISLDRTEHIMMKLLDSVISNGVEWTEPYICSDEGGYVTVEWTGGKRQLSLRIEEDEVEYITLERINTKRKMGGDTIRGDDCFEIWKWLINEQQ